MAIEYDFSGLSGGFGGRPSNSNDTNMYKDQTVTIVDLISEGEIEGLVDGASSVYLDGTPLINSTDYSTVKSVRTYGSITAGDATLTVAASAGFDSTITDVGRRIVVVGAGRGISSTISAAAGTTTIYDSAGGFTAADISIGGAGSGTTFRIPGGGVNGSEWVGRIIAIVSANSATISRPIATEVTSGSLLSDLVTTVASITNTASIELAAVAVASATNTNVLVYPKYQATTSANNYNFENVGYEISTGTLSQPVNKLLTQSNSTSYAFNDELKQHTDFQSGTGSSVIKTASSTLGLSNAEEADFIRMTIVVPSMIKVSQNSGREYSTRAELQIFVQYKRDGSWYPSITDDTVPYYGPSTNQANGRGASLFNGGANTDSNGGMIVAKTKTKFIRDFFINLEPLKPFDDFRVVLKRVTIDEETIDHYVGQHQTYLQSITVGVVDKLSMPHTALAGISVNSSEFNKVPTRSYEAKGIKMQVPTNYFPATRAYTRNVTTGAQESTYQAWDGKFRGDLTDTTWRDTPSNINYNKVYCNNPAWIFYDLLINNRYGVGEFVDATLVDKFQLFQIARYCDELVPDGNGGTEPRFTCNVYIKEKQEAIELLSNLASIFRSLNLWVQGKATLVQDRPKEPVYTFNKANIMGGQFMYQSSGNRLRSNQINVTWNNPDKLYQQQIETVEDTESILEHGRIITQDVVALGCTSQGQANRLGRWMYLTEKLESSVISFKTAMNASFVVPGDIIYIQDYDRTGYTQSGRISATGTLDTNTIPLDRSVSLGTSSYNLHLIFPTGGAYLSEDSATFTTSGTVQLATSALTGTSTSFISQLRVGRPIVINGTSYVVDTIASDTAATVVTTGTEAALSTATIILEKGDLLESVDVDGTITSITTATLASNIIDSSNNKVDSYWTEFSRVETRGVTSTGTVSSLEVSAPFSGTPNSEVTWAISRVDNINTAEITRKYRVITMVEEGPNEFAISANEYFGDKFDAIDKGYSLYQRTYEAFPNYSDTVPVPRNLLLSFDSGGGNTGLIEGAANGSKANVTWEQPLGTGVETVYPYLFGYHVRHNMNEDREFNSFSSVSSETPTFTIENLIPGDYKIQVRSVSNIGQVSKWVNANATFNVIDQRNDVFVTENVNGLSKGGSVDTTFDLVADTGILTVGAAAFSVTGPKGAIYDVTSSPTTFDFSGLSTGESGYLAFDASTGQFVVAELYTDAVVTNNSAATSNFQYWQTINAANKGLSVLAATATYTATETINSVVYPAWSDTIPTSADLSASLSAGDLVKFGTSTEYSESADDWYGFVKSVSATAITTRTPVNRSFSTDRIYQMAWKPDLSLDFVVLKVLNTAGVFSLSTFSANRGEKITWTAIVDDDGTKERVEGNTDLQGEDGVTFLLEDGSVMLEQTKSDLAVIQGQLVTDLATTLSSVTTVESLIGEITQSVGDVYVSASAPVPGVGYPDPIPTFSRWYESPQNTPYYWDGAAWQSLEDSRFADFDGEITVLQSTSAGLATDVVANATAIDTLETLITTGETVSAVAARVTQLESSISFVEDEADLALTLEDDATLELETADSVAQATQTLETRVEVSEGDILVQSTLLTELRSDLTTAEGTIATSSTATSALTTRITDNEDGIVVLAADITQLESDLATTDGSVTANATATSALTTRVTSAEGTITTQSSDITSLTSDLVTANTAITAGATAATALTTRVTATEGSITTSATDITNLESTVNNGTTGVAATATALSGVTTRVGVTEGVATTAASDISALTTTVGENTTTIGTQATSINGIEAQYSVTADVNGRLTGFKLISSPSTSEFIIVADTFKIIDPADTSAGAQVTPFEYSDGVLSMNGNVNIGGDLIVNGTIAAAQMAADSITTGSIQTGAVTNGEIGTGAVNTNEILSDATAVLVTDYIDSSTTSDANIICAEVPITSTGSKLYITFGFSYGLVKIDLSGSTGLMLYQIVLDNAVSGPVLFSGYTPSVGQTTALGNVYHGIEVTLPAASYTIYLIAYPATTSSGVARTVSQRTLGVMEVKR